MDTFFVLSWRLIENFSVQVSSESNAKSGAIDQVTLGDQSVDAIDLLATPGLFQRLKVTFLA